MEACTGQPERPAFRQTSGDPGVSNNQLLTYVTRLKINHARLELSILTAEYVTLNRLCARRVRLVHTVPLMSESTLTALNYRFSPYLPHLNGSGARHPSSEGLYHFVRGNLRHVWTHSATGTSLRGASICTVVE